MLHARLLERFARWFASPGGVWQTLVLTSIVVMVELLFIPAMDPHGFWLLYILTIYSAITQPALAYVGARSGEKTEAITRS